LKILFDNNDKLSSYKGFKVTSLSPLHPPQNLPHDVKLMGMPEDNMHFLQEQKEILTGPLGRACVQ